MLEIKLNTNPVAAWCMPVRTAVEAVLCDSGLSHCVVMCFHMRNIGKHYALHMTLQTQFVV